MINSGISVYEVIRLLGGRLLFLEDHLDRLQSSLTIAGLEDSFSKDVILQDIHSLFVKNRVNDGNIKIVFNYGLNGCRNTLMYFVNHRYPSEQDYIQGVKVITFPFERDDPNTKIWRPDFRNKVAEAILEASAFEALLIDTAGFVREASKANVFAVTRGTLVTPPLEMILPGITRRYILQIADALGIPVLFRQLSLWKIGTYDAFFLSGTSIRVLPVSRVDELVLSPFNPVIKIISEQYEQTIQEYLTKALKT